MKRRPHSLTLWVAIAALMWGSAVRAAQPNVVVFLCDDLGYGDLACHGNPHVQTPQIDAFAREAVEFTHFYFSPICHASRAALMTGRHTFRTFTEVSYHMHPAEVTIAEAMRSAGYKTALFGKWHLGDGDDECPGAQGFDEVVTFPKGQMAAKNYNNPELLHNRASQKYTGYCMDVFTNCAIDFIKQNRDKPFFVYLPANLIHEPLVVSRELSEPYEKMGLRDSLPKVYGMIQSTDDNFGRLRAALKELGLEDNTLLIFVSDNGPMIHFGNEKERLAGLHGLKGTVYEGGIRTPCFMRWPAGFKTTGKVERIAEHIDVMPTILEASGVSAPAGVQIDGRSLMPLLRDPAAAWPQRTLFIQFDNNGVPRREMSFAAITERWKLVQPVGAMSTLTGLAPLYTRISAAEGRGHRSIAGDTPRFELYDLAADPGETKDLAAQQPEVVKTMRSDYNAWFDEISAHARWKPVDAKAAPVKEPDAEP